MFLMSFTICGEGIRMSEMQIVAEDGNVRDSSRHMCTATYSRAVETQVKGGVTSSLIKLMSTRWDQWSSSTF